MRIVPVGGRSTLRATGQTSSGAAPRLGLNGHKLPGLVAAERFLIHGWISGRYGSAIVSIPLVGPAGVVQRGHHAGHLRKDRINARSGRDARRTSFARGSGLPSIFDFELVAVGEPNPCNVDSSDIVLSGMAADRYLVAGLE